MRISPLSNGGDSTLPLQGTQVCSLEKLRACMPSNTVEKKGTHCWLQDLGVQLTDLAHGWSDWGMCAEGVVEADARGFRFTAEKEEMLRP